MEEEDEEDEAKEEEEGKRGLYETVTLNRKGEREMVKWNRQKIPG